MATTASGNEEVNIHHGEVEWFQVGWVISKRPYGMVQSQADITDKDREVASKGVEKGSYTLQRSDRSGIGFHFKGLHDDALIDNPMSFFIARVSAADTPTRLCCTNWLKARRPPFPRQTHPTGSVMGMPSAV